MHRALLILALFTISTYALPDLYDQLNPLWTAWKTLHDRTYSQSEDSARYAIFVENYQKVVKHNAGTSNVQLRLNKFADLTGEEFKNIYTGSAFYEDNQAFINANTQAYKSGDYPASCDWRNDGAVTAVKDQGQCGSCWTFSTTGALEGYHVINGGGSLLSFSEQQILDCASSGFGCNGGWPYLALQYAGTYGIEQESEYPYKGEDGKCAYNAQLSIKVNNGYSFVANYNVDALKTAIASNPVSILIESDQQIFQFYNSGVIGPDDGCGSTVDHGVLAVGYGDYQGTDAFFVKNSWGVNWGIDGYVYLSTNGTANGGAGVCGILSQPVIPN